MVLSKEDFMSAIMARVGDDNSDESLAFIENMNDTYADMESKAKGDGTDWKQKYEENDKQWREKYKSRFNSPGTTPEDALDSQIEDVLDDGKDKTFEDLFTEREG